MGVIVSAHELALKTQRGRVYGPVDLELNSGITVVQGAVGSGRTSLLLTLGGRMRPSSGSVTTLGLALPQHARAVQKVTGIAGFASIDDLEDSVSVGDSIRERLAWLAPWFAFVRRPQQADVDHLTSAVFGDETPAREAPVWSLSDVDQLKLKIAIALIPRPKLLFIDSIEQIQSAESRSALWRILSNLAADGLDIVVAAASDDAQYWRGLEVEPVLIDMNREVVR